MPCDSSHMAANGKEKRLSKVACLLDELDGKPMDKDHWRGYHPSVYCRYTDADMLVSSLCDRLQEIDVTQYSLEMQIWWRDHRAADQARLEREISDAKRADELDVALAKLTPYERKLLGIAKNIGELED